MKVFKHSMNGEKTEITRYINNITYNLFGYNFLRVQICKQSGDNKNRKVITT